MVFILSYQKPYSCPRMAMQALNTKKPAFILTGLPKRVQDKSRILA